MKSLRTIAQPSAAPNGGPATALPTASVLGGPPWVSGRRSAKRIWIDTQTMQTDWCFGDSKLGALIYRGHSRLNSWQMHPMS